jgi:hypothetical protein
MEAMITDKPENNNRQFWDAMSRPPAEALKRISGGRLNGMTDIKPQWRYQVMTETFGPIGVGWKFEIVRMWTEKSDDGQVAQFAHVHLFVRHENEWSEAIPGIGGSFFIVKERAGLHVSDEAVKMAITDALSAAMKMLGVAADIYSGMWDGSKYRDETPAHNGKPATSRRETPANGNGQNTNGKPQNTKAQFVQAVREWSGIGDESIVNACRDTLRACGAYVEGNPATEAQMKVALDWIKANKSRDFAEVMNAITNGESTNIPI